MKTKIILITILILVSTSIIGCSQSSTIGGNEIFYIFYADLTSSGASRYMNGSFAFDIDDEIGRYGIQTYTILENNKTKVYECKWERNSQKWLYSTISLESGLDPCNTLIPKSKTEIEGKIRNGNFKIIDFPINKSQCFNQEICVAKVILL